MPGSNFQVELSSTLNTKKIKLQLSELGKNTTLTLNADGSKVLKEVQKIKTGVYETETLIKQINKEGLLSPVSMQKTTQGIKAQNDALKQQANQKKQADLAESRRITEQGNLRVQQAQQFQNRINFFFNIRHDNSP